MAEIITISINKKQKEWLQQTKTSPSKMFQEAINEEIKSANEFLAPTLKEARGRIAAMALKIEELTKKENTTPSNQKPESQRHLQWVSTSSEGKGHWGTVKE